MKEIAHRLSLDLHEVVEKLHGPGAKTHELRLTTLRDLNSTIDLMFEELEKIGKPELLEKLCPYFGVVWPSARALALEVLRASPCRVLEVGCGLALPSLVATRLGFEATASDFHPQVERFLSLNREPNGASGLRYEEWDWQNQPEPDGRIGPKHDWVIGSDLLYDRELPVPLARAMAGAVAPGGRITLTDPARPYLQSFCDEMTRRHGFSMETRIVPVPHPKPEDPGFMQEIFVLDFKAGQGPSGPGPGRQSPPAPPA